MSTREILARGENEDFNKAVEELVNNLPVDFKNQFKIIDFRKLTTYELVLDNNKKPKHRLTIYQNIKQV